MEFASGFWGGQEYGLSTLNLWIVAPATHMQTQGEQHVLGCCIASPGAVEGLGPLGVWRAASPGACTFQWREGESFRILPLDGQVRVESYGTVPREPNTPQ